MYRNATLPAAPRPRKMPRPRSILQAVRARPGERLERACGLVGQLGWRRRSRSRGARARQVRGVGGVGPGHGRPSPRPRRAEVSGEPARLRLRATSHACGRLVAAAVTRAARVDRRLRATPERRRVRSRTAAVHGDRHGSWPRSAPTATACGRCRVRAGDVLLEHGVEVGTAEAEGAHRRRSARRAAGDVPVRSSVLTRNG